MSQSMPIIEARNKLTSLPEEFERNPEMGAVAITRRGKPVMAIMSWNLYEALVETLEILEDKELMKVLRESIKELEAGQTIPWKQAKKELNS